MADSTENKKVDNVESPDNHIDSTDNTLKEKTNDDITEKVLNNEEKLQLAEDLFNLGSRSFIVKNYSEACDHLATVCEIYDEIKGTFCDELGMPCLIYGKSLIELALKDAESTLLAVETEKGEESSDDEENINDDSNEVKSKGNIADENVPSSSKGLTVAGPSSSIETKEDPNEEDGEATMLQVAWETLEQAAKIFSNQGEKGLAHLAEVYTELGNIECQNAGYTNARTDYEKALNILQDLPNDNRSLAELHYKIGLTYLQEETQIVSEGVKSFKAACDLLNDEILEMKNKTDLTEKDQVNIKDLEETKQEILNKISDIEEEAKESRELVDAQIRKALNNFSSPSKEEGASSSSSRDTKTVKATDISHLIKRKKPDSTELDSEASPSKKPAI